MVKKIILIIIFAFMLVSLVSAIELNPFATSKSFIKDIDYGTIRLSNTFFWIPVDKLAEFTLHKNTDYCNTDCYAEGTTILYIDAVLFENLKFKDIIGNIHDNNTKKMLFKNYVDIEVNYYEQVCAKNINGTDVCEDKITGTHTEKGFEEKWNDYKGEKLVAGTYAWRIEGTKLSSESIDWIVSSFGKDFTEWTWWNSWQDWNDDFDVPPHLNSTLWTTYASYTNSGSCTFNNNWNASVTIQGSGTDGYAKLNSWLSCGAGGVMWAYEGIKTNQDFLDGRDYNINFTLNKSGAGSSYNTRILLTNNTFKGTYAGDLYDITNGTTLKQWTMSDAVSTQNFSISIKGTTNNVTLYNDTGQINSVIYDRNKMYIMIDAVGGTPGAGGSLVVATSVLNFTVKKILAPLWYPTNAYEYQTTQNNVVDLGIGANWYGQTFEVGKTGINEDFYITNISLNAGATGTCGGPYAIAWIRAVDATGLPTGSNLAQGLMTSYTQAGTWFNISMDGSKLSKGTKYAIIMNGTGCLATQLTGNAYPYGNYTTSADRGATWGSVSTNRDFAFVIWGTPIVNISLTAPIDNYNSIIADVQLNCSVVLGGISYIKNVSLWTNESGSFTIHNTITGIVDNLYNATFTNIFLRGSYLWSCSACDSSDNCYTSSNGNRTILVDNTAPTIVINSGTEINDLGLLSINKTINYTVTGSNLQSCWRYYNSTNVTIPCTNGMANITSFALTPNKNTAILFANNTLGTQSNLPISWSYRVFENSQSYSASTFETANELFVINVTYDSSLYSSISASLSYNNTGNYLGTKYGTGNNIRFERIITTPVVPGSGISQDKNFFWNFTLINGGTHYVSSTSNNQTVTSIQIIKCDYHLYNTTSLNFTMLEEGTLASINASIDAIFRYYSGVSGVDKNYTYSLALDNNFSYPFCINPTSSAFNITATISYYKTGYDRREIYFNNAHINNITQNFYLYLLSTASSDIFTFTVIDENDAPLEGAFIIVERWNLATNSFYNVGTASTDNEGKGIINLRLNDAWYRYKVLYNGKLYLITSATKESGTARTLRIYLTQINLYDRFNNIAYSLTFNNITNSFVFGFTDTTGVLAKGCLKVVQLNGNSSYQKYYTCAISSSDTLVYTVPGNGTYIGYGILSLINDYDNVESVVDSLTITLGGIERFLIIGTFGIVISLLIIGTLAMLGVATGSIPLGLFGIIGGSIVCNLLGFLNISFTLIMDLVAISLLIIFGLRRRNG